jgi:integrase
MSTGGGAGRRPRRRARGEGSIFQRASDGLWVVRLDLGYVQGRRKRVTRYAATERAALDELRRLRREHDAGRLVANAGQMTVAEYLDYWMAELLPGSVKASTAASYVDMTRRHIVPQLGHLYLAKLSRDDVRRFIRQLARAKSQRRGDDRVLSGRTVQYVHSILRRALEDARREDLIGRNVAREVSSPRYERREFEPLSPDEARVLLAAAADDRLYPVYVLALVLGLRRGEILGLRWSAVDLDRATLRVQSSLQRVGGQLAFTSPKTKRSRRAIPLPRAVVKVLTAHRDVQAGERAKAELWADADLVFTTAIGTPIEPRNLSRHFEALRDGAKVRRVRFHDLRHSCASLLFELGVPLRMVMEILGHSQISTTSDIYTHVMPAQYREVADALDAWLGHEDGDGQGEDDDGQVEGL